jgi:ribulose kinase
MSFKYGYLKQGVKIGRKLLNCLAEYLTIGSQMMATVNGKLHKEMMGHMSNSGIHSDIRQNTMQEFKENYASKAQAYKQILVNLQTIFSFSSQFVDLKDL